ncbi:MAG: peptidoglycan-binding protein [Cyclobacteriaceae bacterium]
MKKIIFFIIAISLCVIAYFSFKRYQKLNSPVFSYEVPSDLDLNYHDVQLVKNYFESINNLEAYVRTAWYNYKVDVLYADHKNEKSLKYAARFNKMKAHLSYIERKLVQSTTYKKQGLANTEIAQLEKLGMSYRTYIFKKNIDIKNVKKGAQNADVWIVQKILASLGFEIILDGRFKENTAQAILSFQEQYKLYPTGEIDVLTEKKLLEKYNELP